MLSVNDETPLDVIRTETSKETLENMLAMSWCNLLTHISVQHMSLHVHPGSIEWEDTYFRYWPRREVPQRKTSHRSSPSTSMLFDTVLSTILSENLPLWPTSMGFLDSKTTYFSRAVAHDVRQIVDSRHFEGVSRLQNALAQMSMPVSYLSDELYDFVEIALSSRRTVNPAALSLFLSTNVAKLERTSNLIRITLLEYLLSPSTKTVFAQLVGLPIIPMADGGWKSFGYLSSFKVPANKEEFLLLGYDSGVVVDIWRLSPKALDRFLRTDMLPGLKRLQVLDLREHCMNKYFANISRDIPFVAGSEIPQGFRDFLHLLWSWVAGQEDILNTLQHLQGLWIIPLAGNRYQKMHIIRESALLSLCPCDQPLGSFVMSHQEFFVSHAIYDCSLPIEAQVLIDHGIVLDSGNAQHVLQWLSRARHAVSSLKPDLKYQLVGLLQEATKDWPDAVKYAEHLRCLEVFEEMQNTTQGIDKTWTGLLGRSVRYVAVIMDLAVPDTAGVIFIDGKNNDTVALLRTFHLAEIPDTATLLQAYVIPTLSSGSTTCIVERLGRFVLDNFICLERADIEEVRGYAFVPCQTLDGTIKRLAPPTKCINPNSTIKELFCRQECIWINETFCAIYEEPLTILGMPQTLNTGILLERIAFYGSMTSTIGIEELAEKAEVLIRAFGGMEIVSSLGFTEDRWLPAKDHNGVVKLCSPSNCRDRRFSLIVGYSMAILPFDVGPYWTQAFGWLGELNPQYIERQIRALTSMNDISGLSSVLEYAANKDIYTEALRGFAWIPSGSGNYFGPEDIFFDDFVQLEPYCSTIRGELAREYQKLFRGLGVRDQPSFERLLRVMRTIGARSMGRLLNSNDLVVAGRVCTIAVTLYPNENYSEILIPTSQGTLREARDLFVGASNPGDLDAHFVHSAIPVEVTQAISKLIIDPNLTSGNAKALAGDSSREERGKKSEERNGLDVSSVANQVDHCLNVLLSWLRAAGGASFAEWRLEYATDIFLDGMLGDASQYVTLFLIADGG
jgi:hypothetical protein